MTETSFLDTPPPSESNASEYSFAASEYSSCFLSSPNTPESSLIFVPTPTQSPNITAGDFNENQDNNENTVSIENGNIYVWYCWSKMIAFNFLIEKIKDVNISYSMAHVIALEWLKIYCINSN